MSLISLSNISQNFGGQEIFRKINFSLEQKSCIGLVGKNGSGKTTLLNIISKRIIPSEGEVHIAKNRSISYSTQDPEFPDDKSLYDFVLGSRLDFIELSSKLKEAEKNLAEEQSEKNLKIFSKLQEEFELIDGYSFETEIKLVLTQLKFPEKVWNQQLQTFSGGEKTRIQLAKILLQPYDILIMDEPTNHLDLEMIFWLEKYLSNLNKPYIIISHDRNFLDKTVTKIIEIQNKKLRVYHGNYSFYKEQSQLREELQKKEFKNQQKQIKRMEEQIKRYRIWGTSRDSEKMFVRAKELEKKLDKIEKIEKPRTKKDLKMNFQMQKRSGNDVFVFENLSFGFEQNLLAKNVNMRIDYKDKIALVGMNGCGKTTFLRILNDEFSPISGITKKGASLNIGYYDQSHLKLDDSISVKRTIWNLVPMETRGYVLSYLARFGFRGDDVDKKVFILSGGEKARLYLAKLIHEKPNFLILDEPTNHLDIDMITSLEKSLSEYEGTIIFVSHDRYLIENVASKKWFFHQKNIKQTDKSLEELFSSKNEKKAKKSEQYYKNKNRKTNPIILEKLEKKIEELQHQIEQKNDEILSLEGQFYDNAIYSNEQKVKEVNIKIKTIKNDITNLETELEELENRYLELME